MTKTVDNSKERPLDLTAMLLMAVSLEGVEFLVLKKERGFLDGLASFLIKSMFVSLLVMKGRRMYQIKLPDG